MAFAALFATAAGVSAFGKYQEGAAAQKMGRLNEDIGVQEAEAIRRKSAIDIAMNTQKARRLMSIQRLNYSKAGVDITAEGTPLDVLLEQTKQAEFENELIGYNAKIGASRAEMKGAISAFQGDQAMAAGKIGAVGSILSGATNFAALQKKEPDSGGYGFNSGYTGYKSYTPEAYTKLWGGTY